MSLEENTLKNTQTVKPTTSVEPTTETSPLVQYERTYMLRFDDSDLFLIPETQFEGYFDTFVEKGKHMARFRKNIQWDPMSGGADTYLQ